MGVAVGTYVAAIDYLISVLLLTGCVGKADTAGSAGPQIGEFSSPRTLRVEEQGGLTSLHPVRVRSAS